MINVTEFMGIVSKNKYDIEIYDVSASIHYLSIQAATIKRDDDGITFENPYTTIRIADCTDIEFDSEAFRITTPSGEVITITESIF